MTIGSTSRREPVAAAVIAPFSHRFAIRWCTWSARDAATRTLMSGVILGCLEHRPIESWIDPWRHTALAFVHRQLRGCSCGHTRLFAQPQSQTLLDQKSETHTLT